MIILFIAATAVAGSCYYFQKTDDAFWQ